MKSVRQALCGRAGVGCEVLRAGGVAGREEDRRCFSAIRKCGGRDESGRACGPREREMKVAQSPRASEKRRERYKKNGEIYGGIGLSRCVAIRVS